MNKLEAVQISLKLVREIMESAPEPQTNSIFDDDAHYLGKLTDAEEVLEEIKYNLEKEKRGEI